MHSPSHLPSTTTSPSSTSPPLSGPYRVHALLHNFVNTFHTHLSTFLNQTRSFSHHALDTLDSFHPSPTRSSSPSVISRTKLTLDHVFTVVQHVIDSLMDGMRLGVDEWLAATIDLIDLQDEDEDATLPWHEQRLTLEGGQVKSAPVKASPARPSPALPLSPTAPLTGLRKTKLSDGSVLYLSSEGSSSEEFSLESVAQDEGGKMGERRVAVSAKDGLVRVTWKGAAPAPAAA
jgi:hypothetical protein